MAKAKRNCTLKISSTCGTPKVHQPFFIQFSVADTWIPPTPLSYPPEGKNQTDIEDVANDLHAAMTAVANQKPKPQGPLQPAEPPPISNVGKVKPDPGLKGCGFSISFDALEEVNIGICKGDGAGGPPQIQADVTAWEGDGPFCIKVIKDTVLYGAGKRKSGGGEGGGSGSAGWGDKKPSEVQHKTLWIKPAQRGFASTSCEKKAWYPGTRSATRSAQRDRQTRTLAPIGGGDLDVWTEGAVRSRAAFAGVVSELAALGAAQPDALRYGADGYYYPGSLVTSQDGDMTRLDIMGLPGSRPANAAQALGPGFGAPTDRVRRLLPVDPTVSFAEARHLVPVLPPSPAAAAVVILEKPPAVARPPRLVPPTSEAPPPLPHGPPRVLLSTEGEPRAPDAA